MIRRRFAGDKDGAKGSRPAIMAAGTVQIALCCWWLCVGWWYVTPDSHGFDFSQDGSGTDAIRAMIEVLGGGMIVAAVVLICLAIGAMRGHPAGRWLTVLVEGPVGVVWMFVVLHGDSRPAHPHAPGPGPPLIVPTHAPAWFSAALSGYLTLAGCVIVTLLFLLPAAKPRTGEAVAG